MDPEMLKLIESTFRVAYHRGRNDGIGMWESVANGEKAPTKGEIRAAGEKRWKESAVYQAFGE